MGDLPSGTVTFLFTDIEGSTKLVQRLGRAFKDLLERHQALIRTAVDAHAGVEVRSMGDGLFIAFARASDALAAALAAQRALVAYGWPPDAEVRVRMGLHTGDAITAAGDYVGLAVHEAARASAAGHGGQILVTDATRALVGDAIPADVSMIDLGLHRLKDLAQPMRLFQVAHPDLPASFPPLKSLSVQPNNLPMHLTSFVGRDAEVSELAKVIPTIRLLTLVGMGGTGKTRLAVEAAGDLLSTFGEGVWFVDLAGLTDHRSVPHAVLAAIGAREEPEVDPLETAVEHIGDGSMLLVLDNCEHLIDACATTADRLLKGCPALRVLATSREPLGIDGETIRRVPPLALPALDDNDEQVLASDAVRLFLDRALSAGPAFTLTGSTLRAIASICARLDGIPLALELAASRARVISPEQIDARLHDLFVVLGTGARTAPERQRTLRGALRWSDDLLGNAERTLFHRLSVFEGRFSLEAAEGVCAGDHVPLEQVMELLDLLVQRSLVVATPDAGGDRYRLLTVVRTFAWQRLEETKAPSHIRDRHLRWFSRSIGSMRTAASPSTFDTIEAELDDVRAALRWGMEGGSIDEGVSLLTSMSNFWMIRGYLREGRAWFSSYLEKLPDPPAAVLRDAGDLAQRSGALDEAEPLYARALERARDTGDRLVEIAALSSIGDIAHARGDYRLAASRYEEALGLARASGKRDVIATLLGNLGHIAYGARDYAGAMKLYEESLSIARQGKDERAVAESLQSYGRTLTAMLRHGEARSAYDEALMIARRLGDTQFAAVVTSSRANLALAQGDVDAAVEGHMEALGIRRELGDRFGEAVSGYHLAEALFHAGDRDRARVLVEESLATFREIGALLPVGACLTLRGSIDGTAGGRESLWEAVAILSKIGDPLALCSCFEAIAELLAVDGAPREAGLLAGAAGRMRTDHDMPADPLQAARLARTVESLHASPEAGAWLTEGAGLSLDEAVALALAALGG